MFVLVFSRRPCSPASSESHHNFLPNINTGVSHRMQPHWYFCNQVLWFLERTPWFLLLKGGLKRVCVCVCGRTGSVRSRALQRKKKKFDTLICLLCNEETQPTSSLLSGTHRHTQPHVGYYYINFLMYTFCCHHYLLNTVRLHTSGLQCV